MIEQEARNVLTSLTTAVDGSSPSAFTVNRTPTSAARQRDWWLTNPRPVSDGTTKRLFAYVTAYLAIAGGRFHCSGIPLDDGGFLRADKGVIKACIERRILNWIDGDEPRFELTETGRCFLNNPGADFPVLDALQ